MFRAVARVVTLLSLVVVLLGATAATAFAHATLESTSPGAGVVLKQAPTVVTASFDESVGVSDDSLRVLGPDGHRVDVGHTSTGDSPRQIRIGLRTDLPDGTYTVAWHVVSADSHPVSGAFTFSVGHASSHVSLNAVEVSGSRAVSVVYAGARGLDYLGYALLAGALLFLGWCWPGGLTAPRTRAVLVAGWVTTFLATAAGFLLQGVYASGLGFSHLFAGKAIDPTLHSRSGEADLARLALLLVVAALPRVTALRDPRRLRWASVLLAVALAVTWPISDHASVGRQVPLALSSDTIHLVAMACWVGGLAMLLIVVLQPPHHESAATAVVKFSPVAGWCVALIIVTGTYQSWRNVGHWAALVQTRYGLLVLAKIIGILLLVGLGALARRHLHHTLFRSRPRSTTRRRTDLVALRRSVALEAVLVLAILGVTAVLVETATGRESYHPIVQASRPFDTGGKSGTLAITVDPAQLGPQKVTIRVRDATAHAYSPVQLTASLTLSAQQLGPLQLTLHRTSSGDYVSTPVALDVRGSWTLAITVRSDAFDETTIVLPVAIT